MVIRLCNPTMKGKIFANLKHLKGIKNHQNRPFKVADHLPEELAEEQQRFQQIIMANKKLATGDQQKMTMKKGKLIIGHNEYKPRITAPNTAALLNTDSESLQSITEKEVAFGGEKTENGNRFLVYAAVTMNTKSVCEFQQHMRRKYAHATHVSIAYKLTGIDKAHDEGCVDDGEHAMGRKMLEKLVKLEVTDITVAAISFYSGVHIGGKRFNIVLDRVEEAVKKLSQGETSKSVLPLHSILVPKKSKRKRDAVHQSRGSRRIRGGHCKPPALRICGLQ